MPDEPSTPAPLCACGCGQKVNFSPYDNPRLGYKKGEWYRYRRGHKQGLAKHGTVRRYSAYGCRCDNCRAAQAEKNRHYGYRHKYGITPEEYDRLLADQGGVCAVCGRTSDKALAVDHCHDTGTVRGLLCGSCNLALGALGDNAEGVRQLLTYIERH